jgi:hypothetical protein
MQDAKHKLMGRMMMMRNIGSAHKLCFFFVLTILLVHVGFITDVAMVIIATVVAKIYFPESLERGRGDGEPALQARSYSYRRAAEETEGDDFEYQDDDDDDDDDDEQELLGSDDGNELDAQGRAQQQRQEQGSHHLVRRRSSFLEDSEHQNFTKIQVLRRLAVCSVMLNITFVTWGVLQVRFTL